MRTGRVILPVMLAVSLAMGVSWPAAAASPPPANGQPATAGFATPEAAIREYLAGVADADVDRILGASAIDEVSTGFDFTAWVDRLQAFVPDALGPAEYPFYADINRALLSQRILRKVQMLAFGLLSGETMDGSVIAPADAAWAETFTGRVDPARLADLGIEDIRFSNARFEHDERHLANMAKLAALYGADELTERLVLFSFEGQLYDVGFTLARYGDDWKVFDQVANLANTDPLGTARPTTVEEYERETSGDD